MKCSVGKCKWIIVSEWSEMQICLDPISIKQAEQLFLFKSLIFLTRCFEYRNKYEKLSRILFSKFKKKVENFWIFSIEPIFGNFMFIELILAIFQDFSHAQNRLSCHFWVYCIFHNFLNWWWIKMTWCSKSSWNRTIFFG